LKKEFTYLKVNSLIEASRPKHWVKNLLVFLAPLLTFKFNSEVWFAALISFFVFNLAASSIYLFNDSIDYKSDRAHPKKKFRPIASDKLSRRSAIIISFFLSFTSLIISFKLNTFLFLIIFLYILIQIIYCLKLKNEPLLDIFCVASGFLLRSISGGVASNLFISPWFILSVGLLALFLALEKRKAELRIYAISGSNTREVLNNYSMPLLLRLESIVSTGSFITYSLWASGPVLKGATTSWMLLTVPIVLMGIFRYQFLSDPSIMNKPNRLDLSFDSENPVNIFLSDKGMLTIFSTWLITAFIISNLN
ncbi:decaprenyl-phosphate phosphoribosyltransferase, partial [Prochlorococcus sp. AH-716-A09]|nr:decaprenyl-phosphate phosphoribosyltransferase [Prochlorococcus sp. AH-716-A09]